MIMQYLRLDPEVAGQIGESTVMDVSVHPPIVDSLHYDFEDWDGDVLVTSFPCYIVTEGAMRQIQSHGLTGVEFAPVTVTTTDTFHELNPGLELPAFVWLKVHGAPGVDDFGLAPPAELIVSERALELLSGLGLPMPMLSGGKLHEGESAPRRPIP